MVLGVCALSTPVLTDSSGQQRGESASGQLRRTSRVGPCQPLPKSTQIYRSPRSSALGHGASLLVMNAPALHLGLTPALRDSCGRPGVTTGCRDPVSQEKRRMTTSAATQERSREVSAEAGTQFQTLRFPPDRYADWISIFCSTHNSYWVKCGGSNAAERGLQSHQIKTTHV